MTSTPKYLYRYRPLGREANSDEREFDALNKNYMWFSAFPDLNDPAEASDTKMQEFLVSVFNRYEELNLQSSYVKAYIGTDATTMSKDIIDKETSGICCFSSRPNNQAMWAYYANSFEGICIKYDIEKLLLHEEFSWRNRMLEVQYQDHRTFFNMKYKDEKEFLVQYNIKHTDWSHEEEWRLIQKGKHGKCHHTDDAISSIIAGPKTSPNNLSRLEAVCKNYNYGFLRSKFDGYRFEIE